MPSFAKNFIFLAVLLCGFVFASIANAQLKIKVGMVPFEDPAYGSVGFNPGHKFSKMVGQSLKATDLYHVLYLPSGDMPTAQQAMPAPKGEGMGKEPARMDGKNKMMVKDKKASGEKMRRPQGPPSQVYVQGKIIGFEADGSPNRVKGDKSMTHPEQARFGVEVILRNARTHEVISRKNFSSTSSEGIRRFHFQGEDSDLNSSDFRMSSLGVAMGTVARRVAEYVRDTLRTVSFEADIVRVDAESDQVVVNAGLRDGVRVLDQFKIYSVTPDYHDPITNGSLGAKYDRLGVIRVWNVQEQFSEAVILAGKDIQPGTIIRSSLFKSGKAEPPSLIETVEKPWWDYVNPTP